MFRWRCYNKHQTRCIWGLCSHSLVIMFYGYETWKTYRYRKFSSEYPQNPKNRVEIANIQNRPLSVLESACMVEVLRRGEFLIRCAGLVMLLGWRWKASKTTLLL